MEDSRTRLVELYVTTNAIREDVAQYWVDQMTDAEVAEELKLRRKA